MPFSDQTPLMYNLIFGCSNTIHNLLVAYICWKQSVCAPLQYGAPHSALVYVGHVSVWVIFFGDYALSLSLLHIAAVRSQKKTPVLFRNHVGTRSLRKNEIRVGFHRFQGDIIPEPITLFSNPLSHSLFFYHPSHVPV